MKVKTILVSQPAPKTETSPYFELSEKQKVKMQGFSRIIDVNRRTVSPS